ncbi:unnamed protein product [Pleuronectes platessa]|uniref:Uncharacterized protein n=1 Tax=Pleuronectes platessa TaxID=8262 RepID=A0A9N7UZG6_PLEPL|nr:unnamed protein product [Pleuronectes platessa]
MEEKDGGDDGGEDGGEDGGQRRKEGFSQSRRREANCCFLFGSPHRKTLSRTDHFLLQLRAKLALRQHFLQPAETSGNRWLQEERGGGGGGGGGERRDGEKERLVKLKLKKTHIFLISLWLETRSTIVQELKHFLSSENHKSSESASPTEQLSPSRRQIHFNKNQQELPLQPLTLQN